MEEKNYVVYRHKNKNNYKMYIGITGNNPYSRWNNGDGYKYNTHFYRSIKKYGWEEGFSHEILFDNLTKSEAEMKEIELIEFYNTTNSDNGYNIKRGGNLNNKYPVYQYDRFSGEFIKKWDSCVAIEKELNIPNADVSAVCNGKMKTSHNYYFSNIYLGDTLPQETYEWINSNDCYVGVAKYNLNGEYICSYSKTSDAEKDLFGNDTEKKISFINKTSYGFIWKKTIDNSIDYTQNLSIEEVTDINTVNNVNKKICYKYDSNGMFLNEYESTSYAATILQCNKDYISRACRGVNKMYLNCYWKYAEDMNYNKRNLTYDEMKLINKHRSSNEVYQYDLNGNLIKHYYSITEAANSTEKCSTSSISKCCQGKFKHVGGYIWRYNLVSFSKEELDKINSNNRHRKIEQYDMDWNFINVYNSLAEASRETGTSVTSIVQFCNGKYKHANNYKWKYVS